MYHNTIEISPSPENSLHRYLRQIQKFPMLSHVDERALAERVRLVRDATATDQLVNSHLRLVAKIAMGYRGYGLPVGDLISEGNAGLVQAVEKFDPDRGFRLATYAVWWIRAAIQEYILHSWSLVKIGTTTAQKKLFFNLRRLKLKMRVLEDGDLSAERVTAIAVELNVPEEEVIQMNRRMAGPDHSLNAPLRRDGEGDVEWQDSLEDSSADQEQVLAERQEATVRSQLLRQALDKLSKREQLILNERRLREVPATLEELSQALNISRERVRQIEVQAFNKVQKAVKNLVVEQQIRTTFAPPRAKAA